MVALVDAIVDFYSYNSVSERKDYVLFLTRIDGVFSV